MCHGCVVAQSIKYTFLKELCRFIVNILCVEGGWILKGQQCGDAFKGRTSEKKQRELMSAVWLNVLLILFEQMRAKQSRL